MIADNALVIIGVGYHSSVVSDVATAAGYAVQGYIVKQFGVPMKFSYSMIIGDDDSLYKGRQFRDTILFIAIGHNQTRSQMGIELRTLGYKFATIIHPFSSVSKTAKLCEGIIICPGACVSTDAVIHDEVIVNTSASVDHDCVIERGCHICPGASIAGRVHLGENVLVGTGANIIPGIEIGKNSIVGAGATVIRDLPENVTAVGTPAEIIRRNEN